MMIFCYNKNTQESKLMNFNIIISITVILALSGCILPDYKSEEVAESQETQKPINKPIVKSGIYRYRSMKEAPKNGVLFSDKKTGEIIDIQYLPEYNWARFTDNPNYIRVHTKMKR